MKLREAKINEGPLLSDLAFRSKAYWGYSAEFMEACREELTYTDIDIENWSVIVVENQRVEGFYALVPLSDTEVELEALFVEPDAIGQGYGRALISHAKTTAKAMGAKTMIIQGDPNATPFYQAIGGKLTGERESASIPGRFLPTFELDLDENRL